MTKTNSILLNTTFSAKSNYPFTNLNEDVESLDIRCGEKCKVIADEGDSIKLLNLSLGTENAWVKISTEDFQKIKNG